MSTTSSSKTTTTTTLRELSSSLLCKQIDIGTAILPKPLFVHESTNKEEDDDDEGAEKIPCATIECVHEQSNNSVNKQAMEETEIETEAASYNIDNDTLYAKIVKSEFNSVVIEHHLKWAPLCETLPGPINESTQSTRPGRYDFSHCDAMVDWAIQNKLKIKGHVLCWHVTTPSYIEKLSPTQIRNELKRHIYTTMGHFRGRIKTWDVVNEALAPDGSLANNIFLQKLGPSYIEQCFHWAHDADPSAFLIYNDNKVEGMDGPNKSKSDGFYNLLKVLVEKNVPIHGAGMQAHFNAGGVEDRQRVPTPYQVKKQIRRIGELGLKVNISEMDVRVSKLPLELREKAQCQIYHDIIAAALTEPSFDGIWLWGFSDRHTWVKNFYYDDSPLIFNENYEKKPSYHSFKVAISTMAVGGQVGGGVLLVKDYDDEGRCWGHEWIPQMKEEEIENEQEAGDSRPDWLQN